MNLKLSPRDELIVELLAIVMVSVLAVVFLITPQWRHIGELKREQDDVRKQVQEAQATLARFKEAKAESIVNQAELIKLATQVPDEPQLPTLIVELQNVANQSGVDFISVTPEEPTPSGEYTIIPMRISVTGQFRDIVDFLGRVYGLTREVRITDASISVQEYPTLTADLTAQTFVMGAQAAEGTPPPPPGQ